jgi:8-oxo-dGTP pyrophosphatase MutT (NUDIX family)
MYIKIYFNDKPLFLCDQLDEELDLYAHHDDAVLVDEFSPLAINAMIHEMKAEKVHAGIFIYHDLETLKRAFWKKFILIQAAGGWVQNETGEALFIFRRGKWDLPKGKLDEGETLERCAVREVEEETGLKNVRLGEPLVVTWHTYDENGKHILKESHWYRMTASSKQAITPQLEEQITELRWVPVEEIRPLLHNSFPSVADVVEAAGVTSSSG